RRHGRRLGKRVHVGARQQIDLLRSERRHLQSRRAYVRSDDRALMGCGRSCRASRGRQTVDYAPTISNDGRWLAYKAAEGRTVGDVFVMDTVTKHTMKLTEVNPELHDRALGDLKPISWRSFDGMEIWGLLLTPPGWTAGRALPLLLYIHGGPGGGVTYGLFPQFMHFVPQVDPYPTEALASAGFAVMF